ncbi:MAG: hypothetical protein Q9220_007256 [cf. Caloplaca sp. 1 TL-2023]
MNWNSGKDTKIRTSLRDRRDTTKPAIELEEVQPAILQAKHPEAQTEETSTNNRHLTDPMRLHIGNLAYAATESDLREFFNGYPVESVTIPRNPRTSRSTGYAFVTISGSQAALRAVDLLSGRPIIGRKVSVLLAQGGNGPREQREEELSDSHHQFPKDTPRREANISRSPSFYSDSSGDSGSIASTNERISNDSYDDGEIEGPSDLDAASESLTDHNTLDSVPASSQGEVDVEDGEIRVDDDDAMIAYAQSDRNVFHSSHQYPLFTDGTQESRPQVLSQLSQGELELQLRYFHVGKDLHELDLAQPVRCLFCAGQGHTPPQCQNFQCRRCSDQEGHSTMTFSSMTTCSKCKEPGHSRLNCSSQARQANPHLACNFCERKDHLSEDCELHWRTSGRPWESDLEDRNIRFGCYECGRSGHLGNDCPSRRPGKRKGSSSWTYHQKHGKPRSSNGGISIKGRAQHQNHPIMIDGSDNEDTNFYRPKVNAASRPGQIRIATTNRTQGGRPIPPPKNYPQPPLPRGPPPSRPHQLAPGSTAYRPMPSAAKQAWRQFRV